MVQRTTQMSAQVIKSELPIHYRFVNEHYIDYQFITL
jgi:hypothetical protein